MLLKITHYRVSIFLVFALLLFPDITVSEVLEDRCINPETPEEIAYCENRDPQRQRLRPTFSEETRPGFDEPGFSSRFLNDALNGISDPLGGGTVGGGDLGELEVGEISPIDRGLIPPFDPTGVIIPTMGIRK